MSGWFIFDDFDTRTLDVDVYPEQIDTAPARDFKVIDAQGRNGSIIVDQERYPNVERSYWILAESGFPEVYNAISNALLSKRGYCRLTDSWNPDEYYMAYVNTPLQPEISWKTGMGKLLLTFTRKPQRWLTSGETPVSAHQGVTNPTEYPSKPLAHCAPRSGMSFDDRHTYTLFETYHPNADASVYYYEKVGIKSTEDETLNALLQGLTLLVVDCNACIVYAPEDPDREIMRHIDTYKTRRRDSSSTEERYGSLLAFPSIYSGVDTRLECDYRFNCTVYPGWYEI